MRNGLLHLCLKDLVIINDPFSERERYYFPLLPFKRSLFHTVGDFNALAGWEYE